jgi:hypothetical protein
MIPRNDDLFPWSIQTQKHKLKHDYLLQGNSKRRLHKEILVEVHFSLILLLALSTVEDLHIKLWRANMKVEGHEETSLDVVIIDTSQTYL